MTLHPWTLQSGCTVRYKEMLVNRGKRKICEIPRAAQTLRTPKKSYAENAWRSVSSTWVLRITLRTLAQLISPHLLHSLILIIIYPTHGAELMNWKLHTHGTVIRGEEGGGGCWRREAGEDRGGICLRRSCGICRLSPEYLCGGSDSFVGEKMGQKWGVFRESCRMR